MAVAFLRNGMLGTLFDEHTTAERYYPPYLWRGPRPAITAVAGADQPWTTLGYDQRYVWLRTGAQESDAYEQWTLQLRIPETPAVAPPGDYMLVVVDSSGIPSPARFVRLKADIAA